MNNILKNFFEKTKTFFHKTKDFNFLVMYIILFCCMEFIILGAYDTPLLLSGFSGRPAKFLFGLLNKIGLPELGVMFYLFSPMCIPAAITKLFLEKKWSKYLNYFFDHIQYPTIVLICYIVIIKAFDVNMKNFGLLWIDFIFYSVYFIAFLRKFINPLYKHFFKIYFGLILISEIMVSIYDLKHLGE